MIFSDSAYAIETNVALNDSRHYEPEFSDNTNRYFKFIIGPNSCMTDRIVSVKNRISEISILNDDWDFQGASAIDQKVIKNCYKFIDALNIKGFGFLLNKEDIFPTPYGTIVVDLKVPIGLISIEIGSHQIGYFTEYEGGKENEYNDGIETDFRSLPSELSDILSEDAVPRFQYA